MGCGIDEHLKSTLARDFESYGMTSEQYENEHLEEDVYAYYTLYGMTKLCLERAWDLRWKGDKRKERKKGKELKGALEPFDSLLDVRQFFAVDYCTKEQLEQWKEAAWLSDPPQELAKRRLRAYAAFVDRSPQDVLEPFPYRKFYAWQSYCKEHRTPKGFFTEGHATQASDNEGDEMAGCKDALVTMAAVFISCILVSIVVACTDSCTSSCVSAVFS
ncbi:MAG: hypothetical protein IJ131_02325 [Eggerthellaceae bacterium]|nr:hypothetical protein [Eggerthellaceae bacterium]